MTQSRDFLRIALATLALFMCAPASKALAWGSLAAANSPGNDNPAWGHSFSHRSQAQAERRALEECRKRSKGTACEIKISLGSGCAAMGFRVVRVPLSDGRQGKIIQRNIGGADSERTAVEAFERACRTDAEKHRNDGPSECNVVAIACANRRPVQPAR